MSESAAVGLPSPHLADTSHPRAAAPTKSDKLASPAQGEKGKEEEVNKGCWAAQTAELELEDLSKPLSPANKQCIGLTVRRSLIALRSAHVTSMRLLRSPPTGRASIARLFLEYKNLRVISVLLAALCK